MQLTHFNRNPVSKFSIVFNIFSIVCSQPGGSGSKEFEDYLEIRATVEKIRDLQKGLSFHFWFLYSRTSISQSWGDYWKTLIHRGFDSWFFTNLQANHNVHSLLYLAGWERRTFKSFIAYYEKQIMINNRNIHRFFFKATKQSYRKLEYMTVYVHTYLSSS